ncbi:carbon-nitrogen hydrolase [Candidatus Desantisbacteria bacterium]|nr:carbon-nitrogen hydrolase [Candidatus Desantisbacteria bacterium]
MIMVRVGLVQMSCSENKEENITKALSSAEKAAQDGAKIICFQELFSTHWFPRSVNAENYPLAEAVNGPTIKLMADFAKKNQTVMIVPIYEKADEGIYYNSAVVIDADGKVLGTYRKNHVPHIPLWEEKFYFAPGNNGYPVFKTRYASIGVLICWDNFFPEAARVLGLKGAEIIFAPTASSLASQPRWKKIICSHAIANNLFVARVNRVGDEQGQKFFGNSFFANPDGEIFAESGGSEEDVLVADLELETIRDFKNIWAFYRDRRPETYWDILNPLP